MSQLKHGCPKWDDNACGELQGSATALRLPDIPCELVYLAAQPDNVGNVYIGGSTVTVPNGTTDVTSGICLKPGAVLPFFVKNLNQLYRICDNAGDDLTYFVHR